VKGGRGEGLHLARCAPVPAASLHDADLCNPALHLKHCPVAPLYCSHYLPDGHCIWATAGGDMTGSCSALAAFARSCRSLSHPPRYRRCCAQQEAWRDPTVLKFYLPPTSFLPFLHITHNSQHQLPEVSFPTALPHSSLPRAHH